MRFEPLAIVIVLALLPASSPARDWSEHIRRSDLSSPAFVGKDGRQINIRGRRQTGPVHPDDRAIDIAQPREVAPRTYVKEVYGLDGRVRLPASLFYEGKDLALIVK